LPGDGNIRSFGNLNYLKLNQMISFSNEFYFLNKHVNENGFLEDRFLNFEFAFFSDIGYLNQENKFYLLSNSGLGLRLKTNIFNKTFYFRVDFPIHSYNNLNFAKGSKYVISFSSILDIY
jgi:hypothetical protein